MENSELIDKKLTAVYINEDKTVVKLQCDDEYIDLVAEGDCCSETWFEHISLPYAFSEEKYTIKSWEDMELGKAIPTRQEEDELYGVKIGLETVEGYKYDLYLEFRNSSNGYYGGSLYIKIGIEPDSSFTKLADSI